MPELAEFLLIDRRHEDDPPSSRNSAVVLAMAQCAKIVIQIATLLLLVRLVAPEAFGIVAMLIAIVALFEMLRDVGFSARVVHRRDVGQAEWSKLFWLSVGVSAAGFLAICALTPLISTLFRYAQAWQLTLWLGSSLLVTSLSAQHAAMLRRDRRFAGLAVIEIGATVLGTSIAVIVALNGAGIWALVAQRMASAVGLALLAQIMVRWLPSLPRRNVSVRDLVGFGRDRTLPAVLASGARYIDVILIGWWWGAIELAFFDRAKRLFISPVQNLDAPVIAFAMPGLRHLRQKPDAFRQAFLRMLQAICMLTIPPAAVLTAAPDWTVSVLLGDPWLQAAPIVMWLGIAVIAFPAINTASWLFAVDHRYREMSVWSTVDFVLRTVAILAALSYGVVAVVAALALSALFVRLPLLFWIAARHSPVSMTDLYGALLPAVLVAGAVFGIVSVARNQMPLLTTDDATGLAAALMVAIGATVAGFVCLPRGRRTLREIRALRAMLFRQEA